MQEQQQQQRKGRMQFTGTSTWINVETGEKKEFDQFTREVDRTQNFMITYLSEIISLIDNLGNKKMQVVKYILQNMCKSNNTLIITTKELATKSGVGFNTVIATLKILEEANIIKRRVGSIMLSPKLVNNWKASKEANMMVQYKEFSEDEDLTEEVKANED